MTTQHHEQDHNWYILTLKEYGFKNPVASWATEKQVKNFCLEVFHHIPDMTAEYRLADLADPKDTAIINETIKNWESANLSEEFLGA